MKDSLTSILFLLFFLVLTLRLWGLPEGTAVIQGEGSFSINGQEMTIQAPDNSIFSHDSFNLGPSETVIFSQPSEQARALNRISSLSPSLIEGSVRANGQVYFLAPGGLIVGEGALIEAGKLHAIAGSLSDEDFSNSADRYSELSGLVENRGSLIAEEVVLGGAQVINSGSILATGGVVVLAGGEGLELSRQDGSLSVTLTDNGDAPIGGAGDLAGQALLQSGIVQASEVHMHGKEISLSGSVQADNASFGSFSTLDGSTGALTVSQLDLAGGSDASASVVDLGSSSHSVGSVRASGAFSALSIQSKGDLYLGSTFRPVEGDTDPLPTLKVQMGDVRVTDGDLSLGVGFAPIFTSSSSGLLLAASGDLDLGQNVLPGVQQTYETVYTDYYYDPYIDPSYPDTYYDYGYPYPYNYTQTITQQSYDRILLYGQNLDQESLSALTQPTDMQLHALVSNSLLVSDLSLGLDATAVLSLAGDNPSFTGFSTGDQDGVQLEGQEVNLVTDDTPFNQESPSFSVPTWSDDSFSDSAPSYNPLSQSSPYSSTSSGSISVGPLQTAMDLGLFGEYSYYLKAPSTKDFLIDTLADKGGTASAFGGSYAVAGDQGVGMTETSSDSVESSESSDSGGDESESASDDSGEGEDGGGKSSGNAKSAQRAAQVRALGLTPFAPISQPISSPEATVILEKALSNEVGRKLENYIGR